MLEKVKIAFFVLSVACLIGCAGNKAALKSNNTTLSDQEILASISELQNSQDYLLQ